MMSSTMPSAKYSCSGSPLMFWNGSTAIDGLSGSGRARSPRPSRASCRRSRKTCTGRAMFFSSISPLSMKAKIELVAHLLVDCARDGDAAGIRDAFDARSNIDAVAHQIVALHHNVADMDADAQRQRPSALASWIALRSSPPERRWRTRSGSRRPLT